MSSPDHTLPDHPVPQFRRATRSSEDVVIGGVCGGLGRHLRVPVSWVRAAFVVLAFVGGLGAVLYAALWVFLPSDARFVAEAPGLESASRGGRRPGRRARLADMGPALVLAVLGVGVVLVLQDVLGGAFWLPLLLAGIGVALLWRQADEAQRERWLDTTGRVDLGRAVFGSGTWSAYLRVAAGLLLVVTAITIFSLSSGRLDAVRDVWIATVLGIAGLAVVVGPWVLRLASDLAAERAERVRTQERADLAAHLHDSVLQTLALIQRNAEDGPTVARLARAQERELRSWLYAGDSMDATTVSGALREVAARVEDEHGVAVDVVTVGDHDMTDRWRPVVSATREAVVNAAKHAGTGRVDVYAECTAAGCEVFVRDRGPGFDLDAVPEDRLGVRNSIIDRMARHGGEAWVRRAPGGGTEVRVWMPEEER